MQPTNVLTAPSLSHIDEVSGYTEQDKPLFDELYEVLNKHNALNRFGVSLLHSHFPMNENEVLLESTDSVARKQMIEPITLEELAGMNVIETSWRLDANGPQPVFRCQVENTSIPPQHVDRRF